MTENRYKVGKIGKPHGVSGELLFMFDEDVLEKYDPEYLFLQLDGLQVPFFIEEYRYKSQETALIKFEDIDSAEQARQLVHAEVYIPRDDTQPVEQLSPAALTGFFVYDADTEQSLGKVVRVDTSTVNLLVEVQPTQGDTFLLPLADELIADIDPLAGKLSLHIPEGLLDI